MDVTQLTYRFASCGRAAHVSGSLRGALSKGGNPAVGTRSG